jgi:hypothetical protein
MASNSFSRRSPKARQAMPKSSRDKVRAFRERMRAKGLRLVQMWVPDTSSREPPIEAHRQTVRVSRNASAATRKAWADALIPLPQGHATTFDDIADLVGSVDGLPADLASNKDKYLRAGYGRKRHR